MGPGGDVGWGRLTGVELLASACVCSLFGVVLSWEEPLVLAIGSVSTLFCDSSNSSSSPSPDTPEDEGLDVCLFSAGVLLGVTRSGVPLFKLISQFRAGSLSITSDAISQASPLFRSQRPQPNTQNLFFFSVAETFFLPTLCSLASQLTESAVVANSYANSAKRHYPPINRYYIVYKFSPFQKNSRMRESGSRKSVLDLQCAAFLSASSFASSQSASANSTASGYI